MNKFCHLECDCLDSALYLRILFCLHWDWSKTQRACRNIKSMLQILLNHSFSLCRSATILCSNTISLSSVVITAIKLSTYFCIANSVKNAFCYLSSSPWSSKRCNIPNDLIILWLLIEIKNFFKNNWNKKRKFMKKLFVVSLIRLDGFWLFSFSYKMANKKWKLLQFL